MGYSIIVLPLAGWTGDDSDCGGQLGLGHAPSMPTTKEKLLGCVRVLIAQLITKYGSPENSSRQRYATSLNYLGPIHSENYGPENYCNMVYVAVAEVNNWHKAKWIFYFACHKAKKGVSCHMGGCWIKTMSLQPASSLTWAHALVDFFCFLWQNWQNSLA